jgi:signal transduction histidine kinase
MSIENKLKFSNFLITAAAIIGVLVFRDWFNQFSGSDNLSWFLLLVFVFAWAGLAAVLMSLIIKLTLVAPLEHLRRRILELWKKHELLPELARKGEAQELALLYDTFRLVLNDLKKTARSLRELEKIDAAKYQFISTVSHQLRTPVTGLIWSLQMLSDKKRKDNLTNSDGGELIDGALMAGKRIAATLEEILQAAKFDFEFNSQTRKTEMVDPNNLVIEVATDAALFAQSREITIVKNLVNHTPAVRGNWFALKSALSNIVSNAILYNRPHGQVIIQTAVAGNQVEISVADQGIGMESTELVRLFERFYRAPSAITKNPDGNGLGLHFARNVVESHGGRITARSKAGEGSVFTIILPIAPPGQLEGLMES